MPETALKKEFTQRDVQRLRNIYNKQFGASTSVQVGYTTKKEERKEGDTWYEGDKCWTIKNGIKQSYSRIQEIRKELSTPMMCPECGNKMKDKLDKKMYTIHKKCFNCVQIFETQLKIEGKYDNYVKETIRNNARSFIKDAKSLVSTLENSRAEYYTADGQKEDWIGGSNSKLIADKLNKELEELEKRIDD